MSWFSKLAQAYECGIRGDAGLLPIGFTSKEIKYHVILNADGTFDDAVEFPPKHMENVPSSPAAEGRTGDNGTPYPLADALKYLVCDEEHENPRLEAYLNNLRDWCGDPDAPDCLRILLGYLEQKTLLRDLTEKAHLKVEYTKNGEFGKGKDAKSIVTFSVHSEEGEDRLWMRADVRESWSRRLAKIASDQYELCYVTGEVLPVMENHPKVQGNAKLVSGKDAEFPFVYKGRFAEDSGSTAVSYETAAKAYNGLDWLIKRQGFRWFGNESVKRNRYRYGLTLVAWDTSGAQTPEPLEDEEEGTVTADSFEGYGLAVKEAAQGKRNLLNEYDPDRVHETVILGLEAATPGRISVNYYQEIPRLRRKNPENPDGSECETDDYIARLENWYLTCFWERYDFEARKMATYTPTPHRIAEAVLGSQTVKTADKDSKNEKTASKQMKQLYLRLLDCRILRKPLPDDLVMSAFRNVIQPQQFHKPMDSGRGWSEVSWREALNTACALIRKWEAEREDGMIFPDASLREEVRDRSYLYGRMLAIADFVEFETWDKTERQKGRMTNAVSRMSAFVQRPGEVWGRIHDKLIPYFGKLKPEQADIYQNLLGAVESLFDPAERASDGELNERFLLGYYSQRQALFQTVSIPKGEPFPLPTSRSELYGCLAAAAEAAELRDSEKKRAGRSNVLEAMTVLEQRPCEMWAYLHGKLIPYLEKLGKKSEVYTGVLRAVEEAFPESERSSDEPLDSGFLSGYYRMRLSLSRGLFPEWVKAPAPQPLSRDDIFGQLLGLENRAERIAMDYIQKIGEENYRLSNALRYLPSFANRPMTMWGQLKEKMKPYRDRLPNVKVYDEKIEVLEAILQENGWDTDEPLKGSYLHQFYRI